MRSRPPRLDAIVRRDALDEEIIRYRAALDALGGDIERLDQRRSATAGRAILAALGTFKGPVRAKRPAHAARSSTSHKQALRGSLASLRRANRITGTRGPGATSGMRGMVNRRHASAAPCGVCSGP